MVKGRAIDLGGSRYTIESMKPLPLTPMIVALALTAPLPAWAETCAAVPDRSAEIAEIHTRLQAAPSEAAARPLIGALWQVWTLAPDTEAQALLDEGMRKRQEYDFAGAVDVFDALIAYCPDYAEGWNQRAFARFLQENYDAALTDLDRALALSPTHTAALSGKALTLLRMGRAEQAQVVLRDAVALNPWLPERVYLVTPPGQEL